MDFCDVHHGKGFWIFVVYTMDEILKFRGVYTVEAKNGFRGVHHRRGFYNFVVYTIQPSEVRLSKDTLRFLLKNLHYWSHLFISALDMARLKSSISSLVGWFRLD